MINSKKKRYIPSSFLVIVGLMLLFIIASWIGQAASNEINGIGLLDIFTSIWHGFKDRADVILFIFAIGGTLGIMTKIEAIDAGIGALVKRLGNHVWILVPVLMFIFGLGGTTYGMWEETIAFIPILIPVFKKAGYGPFTAILVILVGAGTGCLASTINPFSVGSAVGAINGYNIVVDGNEITFAKYYADSFTLTSGSLQGVRWLSFFVFEITAISLVLWQATRYKKAYKSGFKSDLEARQNTKSSFSFFTRGRIVDGLDEQLIEQRFKQKELADFDKRKKTSLILFILAFILMIIMYLPWGTWISEDALESAKNGYNNSMFWFASTTSAGFAALGEWYFVSVAAIFLFITIIIFAINWRNFKSENDNVEANFLNSYFAGVKDMIGVCLIIATAGGLGMILNATGFGPLIARESAKGLSNWMGYTIVIFIVSIFLSILVPSSSGFANAFMPIFATIATQAFPGRETTAIALAILAFIFANGLANLFAPTSAALMGYTAYAGVGYDVWIKQVWKIIVVYFLISLILLLAFSAAAQAGSGLF